MNILKKFTNWFEGLTDTRRQAEVNRLITRAGRRVTRDFSHAVSELDDEEKRDYYRQRVTMWKEVFWDCQAYRDSLHQQIFLYEMEVERLKKLLAENNIRDPKELPF